MTVARRTTTKADFQSGHAHRSPSQNSRSDQRVVGFGRVRWYTANCCRSARFSRTRFRSRLARTSSSRTTWMNLATMFQSNRPGARGWVAEWARLGLANHRLLKESVLQIWKARKAAVCDEIATAERAAKAIEEKLDRLDQAFLFERSIDRSRARCRGLPSHAPGKTTPAVQNSHVFAQLSRSRTPSSSTMAVIEVSCTVSVCVYHYAFVLLRRGRLVQRCGSRVPLTLW